MEMRKHQSLKALMSYVYRCSTRSWEIYFLSSKLMLLIGGPKAPLKPIYFPCEFIPGENDKNILDLQNHPLDGSDLKFEPEFESKIMFLDNYLRATFHTANKDYSTFLGELALGVLRLYFPDDKDDERVAVSAKNTILKKIDQIHRPLEKIISDIDECFEDKFLEEFNDEKGGEAAIRFIYVVKNLWRHPDVQKSFKSIREEAEEMIKRSVSSNASRKVGTMLIYNTFKKNWGLKERPESLSEFPFHDEKSKEIIGDITPEEIAEFLTFQIISLFKDKTPSSFSSIETTKRTKEYLDHGLEELEDETLETIYSFYESVFKPQTLTDERFLIPGLTEHIQPSLDSIRNQQPMDYIKLNKIKDDAVKSGRRAAIDSRRLRMPE